MENSKFLITTFLIVQIFLHIEVIYIYEPLYITKIQIILCIPHSRSTGHLPGSNLDGKEF